MEKLNKAGAKVAELFNGTGLGIVEAVNNYWDELIKLPLSRTEYIVNSCCPHFALLGGIVGKWANDYKRLEAYTILEHSLKVGIINGGQMVVVHGSVETVELGAITVSITLERLD